MSDRPADRAEEVPAWAQLPGGYVVLFIRFVCHTGELSLPSLQSHCYLASRRSSSSAGNPTACDSSETFGRRTDAAGEWASTRGPCKVRSCLSASLRRRSGVHQGGVRRPREQRALNVEAATA